jgi:C4-dicarboxylate-specific signal transduction histidine kinase
LALLTNTSIRRQVIAASAVLLVVLLIAVAWSAVRTLSERRRELRDEVAAVTAMQGAWLAQLVAGFDSLAAALLVHPAVVELDRAQADRLFAAVLRDQSMIQNVVLTDDRGALRGSGFPVPPANVPQTTAPFVADALREQRPIISELTMGPMTGRPTVIFAYPVRSATDTIAGVLAINLNLEAVQAVFDAIPLPDASVVTLADARGRVVAANAAAKGLIDEESPPASDAPDVPRIEARTGPDGVIRYVAETSVDRGPMRLSVGIPQRVAMVRLNDLWRRNLLIVTLTIGTTCALALWLARILSQDLNRLRLSVQRIAGGDLSPPATAPPSNVELGALQDSFITMAANLREMHDALDRQVTQERKMRETVQSLQRQVVRQERLAAVGLLVSGVAHELNNPLQAILGTAELLERQSDLTPSVREEIAFVKTQSGRAREIIRNLSRFSSQQSGPPSFVDLRDVVNEVVQLRRRDLDSASIRLEIDAPPTRRVYANFTEIEQVALNFVINAQQAIEASGQPKGRISIRLADVGKKVRLEVLDNGAGVSAEDEPKLFQPFFTTKPVGKGTGLGLSVSYGIIESYGGSIGYRNNDWGGATFFFELPGADAPAATSDDRPSLLH